MFTRGGVAHRSRTANSPPQGRRVDRTWWGDTLIMMESPDIWGHSLVQVVVRTHHPSHWRVLLRHRGRACARMAFGPDGVFAFPGPWPSGNDESAARAPPKVEPTHLLPRTFSRRQVDRPRSRGPSRDPDGADKLGCTEGLRRQFSGSSENRELEQ